MSHRRTFIHVPGCACAAGVDYAAIRAVLPPYADFPDGSCAGWLWLGRGWPGSHWVAPWLELHAAAMSGDAAAENELAALLADAPWGAQPDVSFISRTSPIGCGLSDATTRLHAPNRRGVIAEVCHGRLRTWSLDAAWAFRRLERRRSAAAEARYQAARAACMAYIAAGGAVRYADGQEEGCVLAPDDSYSFSARGIARSLGVATPMVSECEARSESPWWWWRPLPQDRGTWLPRRQRLDAIASQIAEALP